jgi:hypothetical protein
VALALAVMSSDAVGVLAVLKLLVQLWASEELAGEHRNRIEASRIDAAAAAAAAAVRRFRPSARAHTCRPGA